MDIKEIPQSIDCLVDANILIYHFNGASDECRDFLKKIALGEVSAFLTTTIIAEFMHRQLLIEAVAKGLVSKGKVLRKLKTDPEIIGQLTHHIAQTKALLSLPFEILHIDESDIIQSHKLRKRYKLFVNDSLNLACALRNNIKNIVTHDTDFERIKKINIYSPTDL